MKKRIKRLAIALSILMVASQITFLPVYADCTCDSAGNCTDESGAVCTTDTTTDTTDDTTTTDDSGNTCTDAAGAACDSEDEENTDDSGDSEDGTETSDDESGSEGENEEESTELSEDVDTDNVVDVVSEDIDAVSDETAGDLIDQAVDEVMEEIGDMDDNDAAEAVEKVQEDIEAEIAAINKEIIKNPKLRSQLLKKIAHLKALRNKLRAKAIKKHQNILQAVKRVKNNPGIFEVRWGNLTGRKTCTRALKRAEIIRALKNGETPEGCETDKVEYTGKISVDAGTLKVRKEVLFEKNDSVTVSEGSSIEFSSVIAGHWDGLLVQYTPAENDDGTKAEVSVTISIGELSGTYKMSEALGRKKIGNDHFIEIKKVGNIIAGIAKAGQAKILTQKLRVQDRITTARNKVYRLRLLNKGDDQLDELDEVIDEAGDYNFDDTSSAEVQSEISAVTNGLGDNSTGNQISAAAKRLRAKLHEIKEKAKARKYAQKLIPFKDTDDDQWYTQYVAPIKNRGIISGYRDENGNQLGEFRPGNNITVAEILKIGLETSEQGQNSTGIPKLNSAMGHWAKGYVKKAEELDLDLVDGEVDLNRPATRGEVVRMMLESLGIDPDEISSTSFSDLPENHPQAKFIEYAKSLGIVSGDSGKTTFRPDDPINRAEAAKIANQVIENVMGESTDSDTE